MVWVLRQSWSHRCCLDTDGAEVIMTATIALATITDAVMAMRQQNTVEDNSDEHGYEHRDAGAYEEDCQSHLEAFSRQVHCTPWKM